MSSSGGSTKKRAMEGDDGNSNNSTNNSSNSTKSNSNSNRSPLCVTAEEVNYLVYRYLQESGFVHSSFTFAHESLASKLRPRHSASVPPGALVLFLQKGLQYVGMEESLLTRLASDSKEAAPSLGSDFSLLCPRALHTLKHRDPPIRLRVPPASAAAIIKAKMDRNHQTNTTDNDNGEHTDTAPHKHSQVFIDPPDHAPYNPMPEGEDDEPPSNDSPKKRKKKKTKTATPMEQHDQKNSRQPQQIGDSETSPHTSAPVLSAKDKSTTLQQQPQQPQGPQYPPQIVSGTTPILPMVPHDYRQPQQQQQQQQQLSTPQMQDFQREMEKRIIQDAQRFREAQRLHEAQHRMNQEVQRLKDVRQQLYNHNRPVTTIPNSNQGGRATPSNDQNPPQSYLPSIDPADDVMDLATRQRAEIQAVLAQRQQAVQIMASMTGPPLVLPQQQPNDSSRGNVTIAPSEEGSNRIGGGAETQRINTAMETVPSNSTHGINGKTVTPLTTLGDKTRGGQDAQKGNLTESERKLLLEIETEDRIKCIRASEVTELSEHTSEVFMCAWNPRFTNLIATGSGDASARIWTINPPNASAGCQQSILLHHGRDSTDKNNKDVTTLEWSPNGELLATGSYDGVARVWSRGGELRQTLKGHRGPIFSLKWNKRGNFLLSGSYDKSTIVWDVSSEVGFVKQQFAFHFAPALDVDWKDDITFASCSTDKTVQICRVGLPQPLKTFSGHQDEVNAVKWSPSGTLLASCSDDCTAKVWDVNSSSTLPKWDFTSHQQEIYTVKWSPTGHGSKNLNKPLILATASFDGSVRLWNISDGSCSRILSRHRESVYSVAFSPSGDFLASGSLAGQLYIWNVYDGQMIKSFKGKGDIFEVAWNIEESRIAACFSSNVVSVIDFKRP